MIRSNNISTIYKDQFKVEGNYQQLSARIPPEARRFLNQKVNINDEITENSDYEEASPK